MAPSFPPDPSVIALIRRARSEASWIKSRLTWYQLYRLYDRRHAFRRAFLYRTPLR
jgi:hypothetical protein